MSLLDRALLAEKVAAVERHLARVEAKLPQRVDDFAPETDAADAVILHLWQAVQIVIDIALAACVRKNLGTPSTYGDAFRRLADAEVLDPGLAERLVRATGFRNVIVHAYEKVDMRRVYEAASKDPANLRAFLDAIADDLTCRTAETTPVLDGIAVLRANILP